MNPVQQQPQRLLNPWMLHFQKLGLELKCPLCLQLFKQPALLPCNHIFCAPCLPKSLQLGSECPACKRSYVDQEVKPAPFMENIVSIYRNLDATFNANLIHPVCSDVERASDKMDVSNNNLRKDNIEIAQDGNSSNGQKYVKSSLLNGFAEEIIDRNIEKCITPESGKKQEFKKSVGEKQKHSISNADCKVAAEKNMEVGVDGIGFIQMEQMSPPFSSDSKDDGNCSDPSSNHKSAVKYSSKRPAENGVCGMNLESNSRYTSGTTCEPIEVKKQKKTNDMKLETNGHSQTNDLASENAASFSGEKSSVLDPVNLKNKLCAFCHTSECTIVSGEIVSYARGKEVVEDVANFSNVTHVHEKCIEWAPQIYFTDNGTIKNLESEVSRANKLKCSSCGKKGAVLGCYTKTCQRSYHVPCAYYNADCRWDQVNFLLLCPKHVSHKFPCERKSKTGKFDSDKSISTTLNPCTTSLNGGKTLVLCGSALSSEEKYSLLDFARSNGAVVSKYWRDNVTHVIAATNSTGACTRTLKVLMAILNGKWIVTFEWVKACMEAGGLVDVEPYEVHLDTHGCSGGPKAGRLRVLNNGPKLFNNMRFYFIGDFVQAFKTDLLNLVTVAGGTIIETKGQLQISTNDADADADIDVKVNQVTLVVYNADLSDCSELESEESVKFQRLAAAEDVAQEYGSRVVGHTWILESAAACCLLPFTSRA